MVTSHPYFDVYIPIQPMLMVMIHNPFGSPFGSQGDRARSQRKPPVSAGASEENISYVNGSRCSTLQALTCSAQQCAKMRTSHQSLRSLPEEMAVDLWIYLIYPHKWATK